MKLRAQIVVDIDAENYVEAAEHQRHLEVFLKHVRARYATAQLLIRERRERKAPLEAKFSPASIIQVTRGRK
jgi:hypothetical protein